MNEILFNNTRDYLARFTRLDESAWFDVLALWAGNAHLVQHCDAAYFNPRIGIVSALPGSGKTNLQDSLMAVCGGLVLTTYTPASVIRTIEGKFKDAPGYLQVPVPLALDEIDNIYTSGGADNAQLTGVLNSGYRRGALIPRADQNNQQNVFMYDPFSSIVWGGLAKARIPDALLSRSLILELYRAKPGELPEPFSHFLNGPEGDIIRAGLADWAASHPGSDAVTSLTAKYLRELREVIGGRDAELWAALFVVAELAGGAWPRRCRSAMERLCDVGRDREAPTNLRFLGFTRELYRAIQSSDQKSFTDLRTCLSDGQINAKGVHRDTLALLLSDADPVFSTYGRGGGLNGEHVRSLLRDFGLAPKQLKIGGNKAQGYRWEDLEPLWDRYLTESPEEVFDLDEQTIAHFDPFSD